MSWRMYAGAMFWLLVAAGAHYALDRRPTADAPHAHDNPPLVAVSSYLTRPRAVQQFSSNEAAWLACGDPVYKIDTSGNAEVVGYVTQLQHAKNSEYRDQPVLNGRPLWADAGTIQFLGHVDDVSQLKLTAYGTDDSSAAVLATMLPPAKRAQIAAEIDTAMKQHQDEIIAALKPVVLDGLRSGLAVVEKDLPAVVSKHRGQLEELGVRYQEEVVRKEIVPLVKSEIWPIVQEHAEPQAAAIGRQIWERASLWRFGVRYVYDKTFRPKESLVKKEFKRFLEEQAVPVVEDHTAELVQVQQEILKDIVRNPKVKATVRRNLAAAADDPELRKIVTSIFKQAIVNNPNFRKALQDHWQRPETQAALRDVSARLDPTITRIGELIFGTPYEGLTPEFTTVLRSQVLSKDRRWIVAEASTTSKNNSTLALTVGGKPKNIPFKIHATKR